MGKLTLRKSERMTSYESIYLRKSIRTYRMEPVSKKILDGIVRYEKELIPISKDIFVRFEVVSALENPAVIKGVGGVRAPYYVFCYSEFKNDYLLNAGCLMEQMALYIHSRGLGTCFSGNTKPVRSRLGDAACGFIAAFAFGIPKGDLNRNYREAKRLPMEKLCVKKDSLHVNQEKLLEAARLAPSSYNSQPWRFVIFDRRLHLFVKKPSPFSKVGSGYRWTLFNVGVMLGNMMVASEELWLEMEVLKLDNIEMKDIPNYQYLFSAVLK